MRQDQRGVGTGFSKHFANVEFAIHKNHALIKAALRTAITKNGKTGGKGYKSI